MMVICPKCGRYIHKHQQTMATAKSYDIDAVFHLNCWESMSMEEKEKW